MLLWPRVRTLSLDGLTFLLSFSRFRRVCGWVDWHRETRDREGHLDHGQHLRMKGTFLSLGGKQISKVFWLLALLLFLCLLCLKLSLLFWRRLSFLWTCWVAFHGLGNGYLLCGSRLCLCLWGVFWVHGGRLLLECTVCGSQIVLVAVYVLPLNGSRNWLRHLFCLSLAF